MPKSSKRNNNKNKDNEDGTASSQQQQPKDKTEVSRVLKLTPSNAPIPINDSAGLTTRSILPSASGNNGSGAGGGVSRGIEEADVPSSGIETGNPIIKNNNSKIIANNNPNNINSNSVIIASPSISDHFPTILNTTNTTATKTEEDVEVLTKMLSRVKADVSVNDDFPNNGNMEVIEILAKAVINQLVKIENKKKANINNTSHNNNNDNRYYGGEQQNPPQTNQINQLGPRKINKVHEINKIPFFPSVQIRLALHRHPGKLIPMSL